MKTKDSAPRRRTGIRVPETNCIDKAHPFPASKETAEEKIARLEKELEDACLRADLYNEIINVAEQRFGIQIRKKAGTKQ